MRAGKPLAGGGVGNAGSGGQATKSTQLIDAITRAIAESATTSKIAVMDHSCGGVQTLAAGNDTRVNLIINWSGGLSRRPRTVRVQRWRTFPGNNWTSCTRRCFTSPAIQPTSRSRTATTISGASPKYLLPRMEGRCRNLRRRAVPLLQWPFRGDQEAGKMFVGANCGLSQDSKWHVDKKGIDSAGQPA